MIMFWNDSKGVCSRYESKFARLSFLDSEYVYVLEFKLLLEELGLALEDRVCRILRGRVVGGRLNIYTANSKLQRLLFLHVHRFLREVEILYFLSSRGV